MKALPSVLPPQQQTVRHEIAGFVVGAKEQKGLAADRLQYAPGHQLLFHAHVMVQRLDGFDPARTTASGVVTNMNGRLCVDADSQAVLICICQRIHPSDIFKDGVCLGGFF